MTKETPGDYLRRILKDKDAMLEVAKLAAEDQRKAMTHNTREVEEIVEDFNRKYYNQEFSYPDGEFNFTFVTDHLRTTLHHQLQKARAEAVAEIATNVVEIIKSVQLTATRQHANDTTPEMAKIINEWLMPEVKLNIIKAIHSELDQDNK